MQNTTPTKYDTTLNKKKPHNRKRPPGKQMTIFTPSPQQRKVETIRDHGSFILGKNLGNNVPRSLTDGPLEFIAVRPNRRLLRYLAQNPISSTLTIFDLISSWLVSVTNILTYSIYESVRLKKIRIWCPTATSGVSTTVQIVPINIDVAQNSYNDISKVISDTSISISHPAYISYKPHPFTPSGSWHDSITTDGPLMTIDCPTGSIMELQIEYLPNMNDAPKGYTRAVIGSTVGRQYSAVILGGFVPVGVTAIN